MSSKIYGLKYLLYKVIPLKLLGQYISKRIAFSYSGLVPLPKIEREDFIQGTGVPETKEMSEDNKQKTPDHKIEEQKIDEQTLQKTSGSIEERFSEISRKYLIEKIITFFEASGESLQDLKKRVIDILKDYEKNYNLDVTLAEKEFDEFIERRRQATSKRFYRRKGIVIKELPDNKGFTAKYIPN
jgi:hypothetical protein